MFCGRVGFPCARRCDHGTLRGRPGFPRLAQNYVCVLGFLAALLFDERRVRLLGVAACCFGLDVLGRGWMVGSRFVVALFETRVGLHDSTID